MQKVLRADRGCPADMPDWHYSGRPCRAVCAARCSAPAERAGPARATSRGNCPLHAKILVMCTALERSLPHAYAIICRQTRLSPACAQPAAPSDSLCDTLVRQQEREKKEENHA